MFVQVQGYDIRKRTEAVTEALPILDMNTGVSLLVIRIELVEWSPSPDIFYCGN